jgi:phosphate:Na+ symporter
VVIAFAQAGTAAGSIDYVTVVIGLLGGLALLVIGMDRMTEALKVIAGDRMRAILSRLTGNRFTGVVTGAAVTAVVQSSSVTTVLVVGFVTSGLMTLTQSIGVIMGANIGTTITAQIIAFDVTKYALAPVALGAAMLFGSKNEARQSQGAAMLGLGMIFFGMGVMGDAMEPLRDLASFRDLMAQLANPVLGVVVGAIFTAVVQSSAATAGVVLALAFQGLITLPAGIAIVLGANIGTSVTAQLAAIGKTREAHRAALVHTLFNVAGVLVWIAFIPQLGSLVHNLGGGLGRQIANAHTIFNVANTLLFVWFTPQIAAMVTRLIPDRPADAEEIRPKYLDRELLRTPALALDRARLELDRMASRVRIMLAVALPAVLDGPRTLLEQVETMDDEVDALHGYIVRYLGDVSQTRLGSRDTEVMIQLMEATNNLEAIGDIIETNLVALGISRLDQGIMVSEGTRELIEDFFEHVQTALDLALTAVADKDAALARRVSAMKSGINDLERDAQLHEAERLVAHEPHRVQAYRLETDIIANLKRIYYFAKRTARVAVPVSERATS